MINLAQTYFIEVMTIILYCLLIFVPLLLGVVMALYADRKIWAAVQKRRGPNVVGPYGLFQVPADGLKFIFKISEYLFSKIFLNSSIVLFIGILKC